MYFKVSQQTVKEKISEFFSKTCRKVIVLDISRKIFENITSFIRIFLLFKTNITLV